MAGWVHIVPDPNMPPCRCPVPNRDAIARVNAHEGSRWQCWHCDKVWSLSSDFAGATWCPYESTE